MTENTENREDTKNPSTPGNIADAEHSQRNDKHRIMGVRTSYFWAIGITLIVAIWLLSGEIIIGGQQPDEQNAGADSSVKMAANPDKKPAKIFSVQTRTMYAHPRDASLILRGRTEADAKVSIMTETSGVVQSVPVIKGSYVKRGTPLCILEPAAREATLTQHKAALDKAMADAKASAKLVKRGYAGKLKVTTDRAQLNAARAAYELAKLDLKRTRIVAPFSGVVEDQPAKIGDYLQSGFGANMACAVMVDIDPLIVVAAVSERNISKLTTNKMAQIKLVTGETVSGKVRYIATSADPKTRTFRVEIAVPNPKWKLRDGVTADISIPLAAEPAHYFSPAILCLSDAGEIGVRLVDVKNIVRFNPVTILANDVDGVWVAGLPKEARVITVGQEYVTDGQTVDPHEEAAYGAELRQKQAKTIR